MQSSTIKTTAKDAIKAQARELGFEAVGIASADHLAGEMLLQYLLEGRHGTMDWMARNAEKRASPQVLWPEVKSIVMLGANYGPARDPLAALESRR